MTENEKIIAQSPAAAAPEGLLENDTDGVPRRKNRLVLILVCLVLILAGAGIGAYLGYRAGIELRKQAQQNQIVTEATYQFQLGLADLEAKRYETARRRFEYIISLDPTFPGAAEKMTEAMMLASLALTPTVAPTPTLEPTPDLRGEEELFNHIQQRLLNKEWEQAIETIKKLRDRNLDYRSVDVDGMYYIALRFLGIQNVTLGQLEVGIYNLTLSERFAPLDVEGINYRNWARLYLSAASFWGADWARVVRSFAEIYPSLPNLRDSSGMTATERFRVASIRYGDHLMVQEQWCDAEIQYRTALNIAFDSMAEAGASLAAQYCANPPNQEEEPPQEAPVEGTPTPPQGNEGGNETPTETPTLEGGG